MLRLAIIGAGVGGCAAAYFAHALLSDVRVTIYGKERRIGGRVLTQDLSGGQIELGAAFFHPHNKIVMRLVDELRLETDRLSGLSSFGIWNGDSFGVRVGRNQSLNALKLASKYRLNMYRLLALISEWKRSVQRLYIEAEAMPKEIGDLLEIAKVKDLAERSFREILDERKVSQSFIDEVVEPVTRLIYNQGSEIGGFAGLTSIIACDGSPIYRFKHGNSSFPLRLAEASKADIRTGCPVERIEASGDRGLDIGGQAFSEEHDAVIIAAPLESLGLNFEGISLPKWEPRKLQTVYTKILKGEIDPAYFRLNDVKELPRLVLTHSEGPFTNLKTLWKAGDGSDLYSITSAEPFLEKTLDELFLKRETVLDHAWEAAYPVLGPVTGILPCRLGDRLFYLNGIESLASAMELSAFAAWNAVRSLKLVLHVPS